MSWELHELKLSACVCPLMTELAVHACVLDDGNARVQHSHTIHDDLTSEEPGGD
eukprot:CAMPEP_0115887550 /NCGR_PEP_ID=MMETSP0287-20121206/31817_1 /TAXON_ID=412157 /ORGANISM="Chrysochromulina rotalis, Strain UIO044" /LENGTH=53 /DNA_ID=CAMNT_0003344141 /DNA_START=173 /DNA_END=334 /DNA_ORIENTATION=-